MTTRIILNLTYKTSTTSNPQYTTYTILDKHHLKYVIDRQNIPAIHCQFIPDGYWKYIKVYMTWKLKINQILLRSDFVLSSCFFHYVFMKIFDKGIFTFLMYRVSQNVFCNFAIFAKLDLSVKLFCSMLLISIWKRCCNVGFL
jgi:hypothetical protein